MKNIAFIKLNDLLRKVRSIKWMKQMIKFEVKRMLRNPGFYIAMMIGLIVSAAHWIVEVLPVVRRMDKYMSLDFCTPISTESV